MAAGSGPPSHEGGRQARRQRLGLLIAGEVVGLAQQILQVSLAQAGYDVYVNVEVAQTAREDVAGAMRTVFGRVASEARATLADGFLERLYRELLGMYAPQEVVVEALAR